MAIERLLVSASLSLFFPIYLSLEIIYYILQPGYLYFYDANAQEALN